MTCTFYLDPYQVDNGAYDTSQEECQNDLLPSEDQPAGKHQLDVTATDGSSAACHILFAHKSADTDHPHQMGKNMRRIQSCCSNAQDKQKYIDPERDLIGPPVDHT